jgi:hypothetical protein
VLLESGVEIVYRNLNGAVSHDETITYLRRLEVVANQYGVALPDPSRFSEVPGADVARGNGWGERMTDDEVAAWRTGGG